MNAKIELLDQYDLAGKIGLAVDEALNWYPNKKKVEVLGKVVTTITDWRSVKHPFLYDNQIMVSAHKDVLAAIEAEPARKDLYLKITQEKGTKWSQYQKVIVCMQEKAICSTGGKRP